MPRLYFRRLPDSPGLVLLDRERPPWILLHEIDAPPERLAIELIAGKRRGYEAERSLRLRSRNSLSQAADVADLVAFLHLHRMFGDLRTERDPVEAERCYVDG